MRLLEREPQLGSLRDYLADARQGQGRLVLVSGEAGVGKTALLEAFHAGQPGLRWLEGACDGIFTPRPLAPLMDVAARVGGSLEELSRTPGVAREQLFAGLERELAGGPHPVVLVVEDVHWADRATLDLLHFLGRRVRHLPALVLVTYRDDGGTLPSDLRRTIGGLAGHGTTRRVAVPTLTLEGVAELSRSRGLGPDDLFRLTGGNPFFVTEALGAVLGSVPRTASDAVLSRVAELDDPTRRTLEVLALLGARVPSDLLGAVDGEAPTRVDTLVAHGLVRADREDAWFRHEIARLAVAESVPPRRAAEVHRCALAALLDAGSNDDARLAHHAEGAGDVDAVLAHAPAAARSAARLGAHRVAVLQYRRAVRAATDADPRTLAGLLDALAVELGVTDAWAESTEVAEEALGIWQAQGDVLRQGNTLAHLTRAYWRMARGVDAELAAARSVELVEPFGATPELARALAARATQRMTSWRSEEALQLTARGRAVAEELDLAPALSDLLGTEACVRATTGGDWEGLLRRSIGIALDNDLHDQAGRGYANLISMLTGQHRFEDALVAAGEGLAYSDEHDVGTYSRCIRGGYAQLLDASGRWDDADRVLAELLAMASSPENRIEGLMTAGRLAARRGDVDTATVYLDEALTSALGSGELQFLLPTRLARAEAAWLAGDAAGVTVETAELLAVWDELDAADRGEVATWVRRLGIDPPAGQVAEPWATQLVDPTAAVDRWDALGSPYQAALAAVDAATEESLRDALERLDALGARATARCVRRLLRDAGARSIPVGARASTRANALGLTGREQDVLDRIAAGMGNAAIAVDLVISPKTVERHVSAILRKLGVADRRRAAELLRATGASEEGPAGVAGAAGVGASVG